jgi:hypothetical protein
MLSEHRVFERNTKKIRFYSAGFAIGSVHPYAVIMARLY